jgi:thymidine phosphorylase
VLRNEPDAPDDLRERSLVLAGRILEIAGVAPAGSGLGLARGALADGRAWHKFQAIAEAQGGLRIPPSAPYRHEVTALRAGTLRSIDSRRLSRIAKLAGAPRSPSAGIDLHVRLGAAIQPGTPLYTIHADAPGELDYALDYARSQADAIFVEDR